MISSSSQSRGTLSGLASWATVEREIAIQRGLLEGALVERMRAKSGNWAIVLELLRFDGGLSFRPARRNRQYFEGMIRIAPAQSHWPQLADKYGKRNSALRFTGADDSMARGRDA